ncbi:tRNA(Met) cytidine acetyltransferase TmcA [Vulcanisaeta thermophila]|uniref:tRNA(Met) cytidine acetyltransferase TmcA n=1 Tax=Vulcanisaeta thermophila TaxID=867917 RepID=UPI000852C039|nr:tRNA(Met) cytidine acetyltransferase TmcA [Vulcanisaeta thermophila]
MTGLVDTVRQLVEDGIAGNHRRLIVVVGTDDSLIIKHVIEVLRVFSQLRSGASGLYMYQPEYPDAQRRMELLMRGVGDVDVSIDYKPYKETDKLLGTTVDFAILDLINDLKPNDVGRLGGIVRGGGVYVLMIPPINEWVKRLTKFQQSLLVPQYGPESVRHFLKVRFWRSLLSDDYTLVINADEGSVIKSPSNIGNPIKWEPRPIGIPERIRFSRKIYELARTQDQVEALRIMEELLNRPPKGRKVNVVLIADRGRGKSAVIGLALAALAHRLRKAKGRTRMAVTAMNPSNVATLMEFVIKGLKALGYDPHVDYWGDDVVSVKVGVSIFIDYVRPYDMLREEGRDIVVVDEAAMIPLPVLYGIHDRFSRVIYASTIHGYEGAGRGFSLRFLKYLRESRDTKVLEYELKEPIRYAPNDPVEKWLFSTFLLDAEPARITDEDVKALGNRESLVYIIPNAEEFFLKDEERLRQFFGIYVQAHYRNEPDDLGMMMDAPHHFVRALALPSGKVVVSVELAEEGGIDDNTIDLVVKGLKLPGNIIPDRLIKYWGLTEFAKLRGWRIIRIATHPELQDRGLGTEMLRRIEEEARERNIDWVGVGFGVNAKLLNFWIKNGYMPVHISPERNPISGEYSVLLVKAVREEARETVEYANREFRLRLLNSLQGPFHDLEPDVVRMLLTDWGKPLDENYTPKLTEAQKRRLIAYAWGPMSYENTTDAITEVVKAYYLRRGIDRINLPSYYEEALICKVLQARPWREASDVLGIRKSTLMLLLREIMKILLQYYLEVSEIPEFMVGVTKAQRRE